MSATALRAPSGHDLRSVRTFRALERHAPFRAVLSLSTFQVVWFGLRCFQLAALALSGPLLAVVVTRLLTGTGATPSTAVVAVLVLDAYVMGAAAFRYAAGRQLQEVIAPPHAALFRALDVPRSAGFVVGSLVPVAVLHLVLTLANVGAAAALAATSDAPAPWWLVGVPVVGGLGVAVLTAVRVARARPVGSALLARGLAVVPPAVLVGVGAGWVVRAAREGSVASMSAPWAGGAPTWLLPLAVGVVVIELVVLVLALRRLAGQSYDVRNDGRTGERRSVVRRVLGEAWTVESSMTARSLRTLRDSSSAPLLLSSLRTLTAVMAGACGAALGGLRVEDPTVARAVTSATTGYLFVTALIVVGLTMSVVGPTASLRLLRWEWESSSRGARDLALRAHVLPVALAVLPALLTVTAQVVVTGSSGQGVALVVALVGGFTLAECLVPPQTRVDGSTAPGPLAPLLLLLLTAPVPALAVVPTGPVPFLPLVYSLSLLGVGGLCLSRRIVHLPSSSPASPPAT